MRSFGFVSAGLGVLMLTSDASGARLQLEDCEAPCAGYDISAELQNDWIFWANPSFLKADVLQPTVTADFFVAPTDYLKLVASIITEPVVDPVPGRNAAFDGVGTYMGELYAFVELDPVTLQAGKFDTIFSPASDMLPGISDSNLASAFDADERLGAELSLGFEGLGLNHVLSGTAFTTDRTALSGSIFTLRPKTRLSDGGAGNTEGISSFQVALNGCKGADPRDCYEDGEFGYRIGFRHQRAGHRTPDQIDEGLTAHSEQAWLAAGTANFELGEDMMLRLLGEAAYLRHFEGDEDDALLLTGSAALDIGQMRYSATYTQKNNIVAHAPNTREHLADFEVIYKSEDDVPFAGADWEIGGAYTFARNGDGEDNHIISLRAVLNLAGSVGLGK